MSGFTPYGRTINLDFCNFDNKTVISIGRSSQNDISLVEDGISRHHADIVIDDEDRHYIRDMGSTNGTFLNGKKLIPERLYPIQNGQEIKFFKTKITLLFSGVKNQKTFLDNFQKNDVTVSSLDGLSRLPSDLQEVQRKREESASSKKDRAKFFDISSLPLDDDNSNYHLLS
ncbi:MAG: FHA domain-containing protein [Candidatus Caenarcaniphilales bacterium]|nr:FHA domain-containing protein [Candidatus Caenarcaniphilales bacterium]